MLQCNVVVMIIVDNDTMAAQANSLTGTSNGGVDWGLGENRD